MYSIQKYPLVSQKLSTSNAFMLTTFFMSVLRGPNERAPFQLVGVWAVDWQRR